MERTRTKISEIKKIINKLIKNGNKIFWVGRLTANKQYFNLGLKGNKRSYE
jgi:hypothetical protein